MKKIIVYCHGYNSSSRTDKVSRIANAGYETLAWDIDLDPDVSIPFLTNKLDEYLSTHFLENIKLIFVGTSLGAAYASTLAKLYDAKSILINPCIHPVISLPTLNIDVKISNKYTSIVFNKNDTVIVAENDELFDFSSETFEDAGLVIKSQTGGHRFNGVEFELVLNRIAEL